MLRGAIEVFDGHILGGWICSAVGSLRDQTVLAFVDDACVGAGRIEQFRQDLADVGLGDGYCGFNFAVSPPPGTPRARIVVKLDGSDFALLDRGGRIVDPLEQQAQMTGYSIESIEWMRERKWLDAPDYGFLKGLASAGFHDRRLRSPASLLAPAAEAKRLLSLYHRGPVRIQEALIELRNLADESTALTDGAIVPIIAIHAPRGSILQHEAAPCGATTRHTCGEDRLFFLDVRAKFGTDGAETAHVFRAV